MSYPIFEEKLLSKLEQTGTNKLAVIYNGRFVTYKAKMVYVFLNQERNKEDYPINFIIRRKEKPRDIVIKYPENTLFSDLLSNELYGIKLNTYFNENHCKIEVDIDLGLLIIESGIYNSARVISSRTDYKIANQVINGNMIERSVISKLVHEFKMHAYDNFRNVIFSKTPNRFLTQIYSKFRFYKIMYGFIPVIIDYPMIYNPLLDDCDSKTKDLVLYKEAIRKNRFVGKEGKLNAYMLTHEEICNIFSMKHFMRFTPMAFYDLLVGLLNPSLQYYPSVENRVYTKPDNLEINTKLPAVFSKNEYILELRKYQDLQEKDDSEHTKDIIETLLAYTEKDSLYYYCEKNIKNLLNFGPSVIDPKNITVDTLYSYFQEMVLNFE